MHGVISSIDRGEEFMAHYGVKGMHWGIRKDPETDADTSNPPRRMLGYKTDRATFKQNLPSLRHPIDRISYVNSQRTTAGKTAMYGIILALGGLSFVNAMRSDKSLIENGYDFIRNRFS